MALDNAVICRSPHELYNRVGDKVRACNELFVFIGVWILHPAK